MTTLMDVRAEVYEVKCSKCEHSIKLPAIVADGVPAPDMGRLIHRPDGKHEYQRRETK